MQNPCRLLWCLSFILVVAGPAALAAENGANPMARLDVTYDAETHTLEGTYELEFSPESATTYFSLLANLDAEENPYASTRQQDAVYPFGFEPSRLSILSVKRVVGADAEPLDFRLLAMPPSWQTYSLDDTVLAVDVAPSSDGAPVTLRCQFLTEVPRTTLGDQAITDGILTWRFGWFPMLLPDSEQIVEQDGIVHYENQDSFPLVFPWTQFSATISLPADLHLITGADRSEALESGDDAVQRVAVSNDSPSRSLAITIGPSYESYRLESAANVEVLYLPHHEREARLLATLAIDILEDYTARYGPYPRAALTIVENPSSLGQAFAADGIVWLSSRFFTHQDVLFPGALSRITEYVLAHEIAHQWVGLGTGVDLDAEAWLSEGLAQYLSIRYFEERYGAFEPNVFAPQIPGIVGEFVEQQWGFFNLREHFVELPYLLTLEAGFDEELIKPTEYVRFGNAETVRLYDKGYLVARALASLVGTEAFEQALTQIIVERRADILDARSFQSTLEDASGLSLQAFFDYWMFGPGVADYSVKIVERSWENDIHTTRVLVAREGGVPQPVVVEVTMQSGGTARQIWDGAETSAVMEFSTPSWVEEASIDPDHRIPDENRLNNHAPVRIVGAVSENVLPLDAYVLAPSQADGGVTFSYLDRLRVSITQTDASASIKIGREHRITVLTSFASPQLTGRIDYTVTGFAPSETGSAATFWEPVYALTVTAARHAVEGQSLHSLRLQATDLRSGSDSGSQSVAVRLAPGGIAQLELAWRDEVRLLPGVYFLLYGRVGLSSRQVPSPLAFSMPELRSIAHPLSNNAAVARFSLELPGGGPLPYSLFQLAMLDDVRSRLYVTVGKGWTSPDEFGTTSVSAEAGMEQILDLSTLGGLISLTARIGVATPVLGDGATTLYGSISF